MQATHPQSDARDRRPDPPGKHARWGVPRCAVGFEVWPPQGQGLEKSPYVSLLDPDPDIKRLRGAEDVVIKRDNIHVRITYPLSSPTPVMLPADTPAGFTRAGLARAVSQAYKRIYQEEKETSTFWPSSESVAAGAEGPGTRSTTDGRYGIWGHELSELKLFAVLPVDYDGDTNWKLYIDV